MSLVDEDIDLISDDEEDSGTSDAKDTADTSSTQYV